MAVCICIARDVSLNGVGSAVRGGIGNVSLIIGSVDGRLSADVYLNPCNGYRVNFG